MAPRFRLRHATHVAFRANQGADGAAGGGRSAYGSSRAS